MDRGFDACVKGNLQEVKLLLDRGADMKVKVLSLVIASRYGHTEIVKLLLDNGADIEAKNDYNKTPLIIASEEGHTEIVKLLLERGADIAAKDKFNYTAFDNAWMEGHKEIALLLSEAEAEQYRDILNPPQMLKRQEQTQSQSNNTRPGR
jgi:ankyrin repeat protein